jgi:hypothetical protein
LTLKQKLEFVIQPQLVKGRLYFFPCFLSGRLMSQALETLMSHADGIWLSKSAFILPYDVLRTLIKKQHYELQYPKQRDTILFGNVSPVMFHVLLPRTFLAVRI